MSILFYLPGWLVSVERKKWALVPAVALVLFTKELLDFQHVGISVETVGFPETLLHTSHWMSFQYLHGTEHSWIAGGEVFSAWLARPAQRNVLSSFAFWMRFEYKLYQKQRFEATLPFCFPDVLSLPSPLSQVILNAFQELARMGLQ